MNLYRVPQLLSAAALVLATAGDAGAQARRALLIGIDRYEATAPVGATRAAGSQRDKITNLSGAVADAMAMRDLLQTRYDFPAANTSLITDQQATRAGILAAIQTLTAQSQRGDVVVFFYAGHGSERVNSLSPEASKKDQTLVPVDANAGAFDIRDKELARLFNGLLEKGVELVLLFDSCHSGSVTRGGLSDPKSRSRERWAGADPRDAADAGVEKSPEARPNGAIVISAAQDDQLATEKDDANGQPHGIFTASLIATLQSVPPSESVEDIFRRVKARMQTDGHTQEPVLAGPDDRRRRPLLGGMAGAAGRTRVAVLRVDGGMITLQGGPAVGIRKGAELKKIGSPADTGIRLQVDTIVGVSTARAHVAAGNAARVAVGDLFELSRWVGAPNAGITLAIPSVSMSLAQVTAAANEIAKLRAMPGIEWIDDPSETPADTTVSVYQVRWNGSTWELQPQRGSAVALTASPTAAQIRAAIESRQPGKRARVILTLPPTPEIARTMRASVDTGMSVRLTTDASNADYVLVGRARGGSVQYAIVQPSATRATNHSSLPLRSEWVGPETSGETGVAARLLDHGFTLAKVRSWLQLEPPPSDERRFPYRLAFMRLPDSTIKKEGPFVDGEVYEMVLVADPALISAYIERRRVYIFGIDNAGRGQLVFPQSQVENKVPFALDASGKWPARIPLGPRSQITVGAPFGTDTFILVSSDEVIDPSAFRWEGVRSADKSRGEKGGPLTKLLGAASGGTRGFDQPTPVNWSIDRVPVLSKPR